MEVLTQTPQLRTTPGRWREAARHGFRLVICAIWAALASRSAGQEVSREYPLKAVLLYNLTQFVEWPASAFESAMSPLVICVLGADPFGVVLDEAVRAERSNNRPIVIRRINRIEEAHDAQVVFFGPSWRREISQVLEQIRGRPILTVGDFDGFLRAGGTVRMASTMDRKIKLRVNLDRARANGLAMSSKLLRVCTIVQAGDE